MRKPADSRMRQPPSKKRFKRRPPAAQRKRYRKCSSDWSFTRAISRIERIFPRRCKKLQIPSTKLQGSPKFPSSKSTEKHQSKYVFGNFSGSRTLDVGAFRAYSFFECFLLLVFFFG